MADIEDILIHSWNKDAVNLKPALDDVMAAKVAEKMGGLVADVASNIFGNSNGGATEEEVASDDSFSYDEQSLDNGIDSGTDIAQETDFNSDELNYEGSNDVSQPDTNDQE